MQEISLSEMLKAGVHFGHKLSKRHPKMEPFIFTVKNGLHIIDLEKTKEQLEKALTVLEEMAAAGKTILFVGTKKQAKDLVKKYALACEMPYVTEGWTGGLLTNFGHVSRSMKELKRLRKDKEKGDLSKYTKKEQLDFDRKIVKLDKAVGGIVNMEKLPDALFILDLKEDKTAVQEAAKKKIVALGIVDTNNNPEAVQYPIPANDDAIKALDYILNLVSNAISAGRKRMVVPAPSAPVLSFIKK